MDEQKRDIWVIGAGTFGTALSERLAWNPTNAITLFTIESEVFEDLSHKRMNSKYFPGRQLSASIKAACSFEHISSATLIFLAVPSFAIESVSSEIFPLISDQTLVINLAKGFSHEGKLLYEVLPFFRLGVLKGPTFAVEIMNGMPSALTFGGKEEDYQFLCKEVFAHTAITLDFTEDIRGVELLSIVKNAYAISVGIVSGRYNSPNVDFQVITKALNEMRMFLMRYKGNSETVFNYCGIGDLGLTSLNDLSRNRTLGLLIGKGFFSNMQHTLVIEGMKTVKLLGEKIRTTHEEALFPLLNGLYSLMYEHKDVPVFCSEILSLSS